MRTDDPWLTADDIARECGMSADWVRRQILEGRLQATAWMTPRTVYRIRRSAFEQFRASYSGPADDPRFSREG